jgi:hypothetical protein
MCTCCAAERCGDVRSAHAGNKTHHGTLHNSMHMYKLPHCQTSNRTPDPLSSAWSATESRSISISHSCLIPDIVSGLVCITTLNRVRGARCALPAHHLDGIVLSEAAGRAQLTYTMVYKEAPWTFTGRYGSFTLSAAGTVSSR